MSAEAHKFKVGLFVIGGVVILAAALIWLGASKFFSETRTYTTYFEESVQGLDVGSSVKFLGVAVGTVSKIRIAADGRLVEAQLELERDFKKEDDMRTELAMAGITGMKFVEITRDADALPLVLTFKPPPDYIPSKASSTAEILKALENVYQNVMKIDFKGLSDNAKAALATIDGRIKDPKVDRLLEGMAGTAERLKYLLSKKQTENAIDEIDATIAELKGLVQNIRQEVIGMDLKGTFAELRLTIQNLNEIMERVDNELTGTLIGLRRTTDNLARATEKISQDPAQIIFGEPPPERNTGGPPEGEGR